MTKAELISVLAESHELPKAKMGRIVDEVFDQITVSVQNGEEVSIAGFGKFKPVQRPQRRSLNPRTGEAIDVPARGAVKFTPAKAFKEAVK